jgi:hypothetical protein
MPRHRYYDRAEGLADSLCELLHVSVGHDLAAAEVEDVVDIAASTAAATTRASE